MGYSVVALKNKIMEMYPEIEKNSIQIGFVFNEEKNTYFVNFRKGLSVFATHLEKNETDACMDGVKFAFLGAQIGRWMANFAANQMKTTDMPAAPSAQTQGPVRKHCIEAVSGKREQWATR